MLNLSKIIQYKKEFLTDKKNSTHEKDSTTKTMQYFWAIYLAIFFTAILLMVIFNFLVEKIVKHLFCHMKNNVPLITFWQKHGFGGKKNYILHYSNHCTETFRY